MNKLVEQYAPGITNAVLRLAPIGAKFFLLMYMGKFFSLTDIGVYGLLIASTSFLTIFLGQKLDYVISRHVVGIEEKQRVLLTRDEAIYFALNFVLFAVVVLLIGFSGILDISGRFLFYGVVLVVSEGFANAFSSNMISLNRQIWANVILLIRSGLWIIPVIAVSYFYPSFRTIDTVVVGWIAGSISSLGCIALLWRKWPWHIVFSHKINWLQLRVDVRGSLLIWLGALGASASIYVDRFVVGHFLTLESVGVATLYFSFCNTMLTLIQSGVSSFSYPKLVHFYKQKDEILFKSEARHTGFQVLLGSLGMAVFLGVFVPLFAMYFDKAAVMDQLYTFALLLVGTFFRANAETPYLVLFARHQDRPIWLGNILFLLPALGFNLLFVPLYGLSGIGYSAMISGLFLLLWRWYYVRRSYRCASGSK